ncbi:MAG: hypothetical protein R3C32_10655 [Chloroflexota bacterium]
MDLARPWRWIGDRLFRRSASGARGIVMAAAGAGNTDPCSPRPRGTPSPTASLWCSRPALAGRARAAYGFPGGGRTGSTSAPSPWARSAATAWKVVLALALGVGLDDAALRRLFATLGG